MALCMRLSAHFPPILRATLLTTVAFVAAGCSSTASSSHEAADAGPSPSPSPDSGPTSAGDSDAGTAEGDCPTSVTPSPGVVVTDCGPVQGTQENGTWAYLGIPYAAPPVGALRWAPTQAHACWATVLPTTTYGQACLQITGTDASPTVIGQEDCLTADVWTPMSATPTSKLAVMVFIHGGGNVQGATNEQKNGAYLYDGANLANHQNVIVVDFNYRLGALGFLAHPSFGANPGNYGTKDRIFLLGWVQRNVAAFGGDPSRVLVFGQSAGAVDTCDMVTSPLTKGFFTAALMESGACVAYTASSVQAFATQWATKAGCGGASDAASCLRGLSGEDVTLVDPEPADISAPGQGNYQPNVNGVELVDDPGTVLRSGSYHHVPIVFGSNADETSQSLAPSYPQGMTQSQYESAVLAYASGNQSTANRILAEYPASNYDSPLAAFVQVSSDAKFTTSASFAACSASLGQSDAPIYRYFYPHHVEDSTPTVAALGAWHGQEELLFLFESFGSYEPSAGEQTLSASLQSYWANFAKTGTMPGTPTWSPYTPTPGPTSRLTTCFKSATACAPRSCRSGRGSPARAVRDAGR